MLNTVQDLRESINKDTALQKILQNGDDTKIIVRLPDGNIATIVEINFNDRRDEIVIEVVS